MTTPFKVDNWLVDPSDNQARHAISGTTCTLEPRLMRLLCTLAATPRRVISRDTLVESVWPHVIVNENSLTRAVSDLRKALQTTEVSGKQLIETVPKRGYRLMAEVETLSDHLTAAPVPPAETVSASAAQTVQPSTWQRWLPAMAASLLLMLTAVIQLPGRVLEPLAQSSPPETDLQQSSLISEKAGTLAEQPLIPARNALAEQTGLTATNTFHWHGEVSDDFVNADSEEQVQTYPAAAVLAPEGNLLAYVEQSSNASRLMLRPTYNDARPWTAFTTDETIRQLQWSPLGDGILFTLEGKTAAGSNEPGHLYRRLMLLDIQSLALHELYRKDDSPAASSNSGNLT